MACFTCAFSRRARRQADGQSALPQRQGRPVDLRSGADAGGVARPAGAAPLGAERARGRAWHRGGARAPHAARARTPQRGRQTVRAGDGRRVERRRGEYNFLPVPCLDSTNYSFSYKK